MPGNIGPLEIAIVLIIALLVFGPKRLPEFGKSLGKGIREFKDSIGGDHDDDDEDSDQEAPKQAQIPAAEASPVSSSEEPVSEAEVVRDKT
ncbi:MAG TPA: twin-arginine translocase TatA/TatE family subunit [Solirubrobacterales bacterium]|nr:twin-arginine translocase TatA/TatE family subunit [Solirubrobacterales bacterium]